MSTGIVTEQDREDLETAELMVREGKKLRQRVLGRIRQRRYRQTHVMVPKESVTGTGLGTSMGDGIA